MSASRPPKTKPTPNFFSTHSVVLPVNLQTAYKVLGTAAGHDRVCHLSKLCSRVELFEKDKVTLPVPEYPAGKRLGEVSVREASASTASDPTSSNDGSTSNMGSFNTLTRQHFVIEEVVSHLFGLFKTKVRLMGTLTWDDSVLECPSTSSLKPVEALYESRAESNGILVWKLRTFETVVGEPDKTRVTEKIEGWSPILLRPIVQSVAASAHHAHMELYHKLF